MKYGDVLAWKDEPNSYWPPEPIGRFMYLRRQSPKEPNFIYVACLVAAPESDWEVGMILPCNGDELEVVREVR